MNKINFATVGTSPITESFIKGARHCAEFNLRTVYSRSEEKAKKFAEKYTAERHVFSFDELVSDPKIDAVYIASPNSCHAKQAIVAMNNGKHVLCEKPVASNAAEYRSMVSAAKRNGVMFMEALKSTLMPGFGTYAELISEVGQIRSVFMNFCKYSSRYDAHKRGEDVNTFKAEFSNGALMDLGVYCLYPIIKLFGKPKAVKAFSSIIPGGVDGSGVTILDYDGFTATARYSKTGNSYLSSEIQGEKATVLIDSVCRPKKSELIRNSGKKEVFDCELSEDDMCYEVREFIDCILSGKKESDVNDFQTSLTVMEVIDRARFQSGISYPADKTQK